MCNFNIRSYYCWVTNATGAPRYFFSGLFPVKAIGAKRGKSRLHVAKSLHQYRFPINTLFSLLLSCSSFSERMGDIPLADMPALSPGCVTKGTQGWLSCEPPKSPPIIPTMVGWKLHCPRVLHLSTALQYRAR